MLSVSYCRSERARNASSGMDRAFTDGRVRDRRNRQTDRQMDGHQTDA